MSALWGADLLAANGDSSFSVARVEPHRFSGRFPTRSRDMRAGKRAL